MPTLPPHEGPRLAKRLHADAAAVCDDCFAELGRVKDRGGADGLRAAGPTITTATPAPLPPSISLRVLAGELGQEIIGRNSGAPSDAAFRNSWSIPPGPWGGPREPWAYQRYVLALSMRNHTKASAVDSVTGPCKDFLSTRGIEALTPEQWEEFCEVARPRVSLGCRLGSMRRRPRPREHLIKSLAKLF